MAAPEPREYSDKNELPFDIGKTVGRGAFAVVHKATRKSSGEEFAAKVFTLASAGELQDELQEAILPWFGCLISGISYLHSQDIRHRDIKPKNILIKGSRILFADFGISMDHPGTTIRTDTASKGTTQYKAPEWKPLDPGNPSKEMRPGRAADIFSLGGVFLDMLLVYSRRTLRMVRDSTGIHEPYKDHAGEWISTLQQSPPPDNIAWYSIILLLCQNMLQKRPDTRPTARELELCWSYQPFEIVPPTGYDCHVFDSSEKYCAIGANEVLEKASANGHSLMRACEAGDKNIMGILIGHSQDVDINGVLREATAGGLEAIVKVLLEKGADVNSNDIVGRTLLSWASRKRTRGSSSAPG
ncbi:hypothetical protein GJ744_000026 [Endocarpon pusillum]|uniref:Protein kinase domain-containing protein n=1 Tax=Endocarpon pusillum TaxID=364733 RepID=A0A8H7EBZ5_9EURO|nr:hypothetical protein GJ744_000026 [Endocarpon pusillum]